MPERREGSAEPDIVGSDEVIHSEEIHNDFGDILKDIPPIPTQTREITKFSTRNSFQVRNNHNQPKNWLKYARTGNKVLFYI